MKSLWLGLAIAICVGGYVIAALGKISSNGDLVDLGFLNMLLGAALVVIRLYESDLNE